MTVPKRRFRPPSSTERALLIALLLHVNTSLIDPFFKQVLSEESTRFAGRVLSGVFIAADTIPCAVDTPAFGRAR